MQEVEWIWMDGKLVPWKEAKVHVLTHALHYGTAVFEGIRCYKTERGPAVFRLIDHMKRFFDRAKICMIKIPYSLEELVEAVKETIRANKLEECYIRPLAYVGYGEMGLYSLGNPVGVAIAVWPWGAYLGEEGLVKGIRCMVSSWRKLHSQFVPPQAKASANYLNAVLAKLEALSMGYEEAILLNLDGYVSEGSGENIFVVKDGVIYTPPPEACMLMGITRDSVIKLARDMGYTVVERNILREELYIADEVFLTGTAAEVTPVREIDGRVIGEGRRGPITEAIQKKFFDVVHGREEAYYHWLDFV